MPPPKLPKLVPWHSPAEFIQVYNWFYPELTQDGAPDIRSQECALRRVSFSRFEWSFWQQSGL